MIRFLMHRLLMALAVALAVSALSFSLLYLAGDPALVVAGESATEADIQAVRHQYGFDRPFATQYMAWVGRALQGDFGESFYFKAPVAQMIADRLPTTLILGFSAIVFAILLAVPLGVVAAIRPNSWIDRAALLLAVVGQAVPTFWLALVLIVVFAVRFPILPASGSETWRHFILPTIVLGYYAAPAIMRLTRAGMIDVLGADYIRTARAKGLPSSQILIRHAMRNAMLPVVSLAAVQFGFMLGGSVVVETVFALHGLGYFAWEAINRSDMPAVQAIILVMSLIYIALVLCADLVNAWLDPRLRVKS